MKEHNLGSGVNYVEGTLKEINGENGQCNEVVLSNGEKLRADILVISQGVTPNTDFLPSSVKKDKSGHVTCNTFMRSTDENIWAAGDVASHPWSFNGERINSAHYSTAITQGSIAAYNMMGKWVPNDNIPIYWSSHGMKAKVYFSGHGSNWDKTVIDGDLKSKSFIGYHFKDGRVEGFSCMGRVADILLLNTSQRLGIVFTDKDFKNGKLDLEALRHTVESKRPKCMCKRKVLNEAEKIESRCGL